MGGMKKPYDLRSIHTLNYPYLTYQVLDVMRQDNTLFHFINWERSGGDEFKLNGQPNVDVIYKALIRREWISTLQLDSISTRYAGVCDDVYAYRITTEGYQAWEQLDNWYNRMNFIQKSVARIFDSFIQWRDKL